MNRNLYAILSCLFVGSIAIACGGAHTVSSKSRSPHFNDVASHLDLGGVFYLYADIDGDVQRGAELINEAIRSSGKVKTEVANRIDAVKIAEDLGLTSVTALGFSSVKDGDSYINKGFIQTPGGRKGLLQMFGRDPHPFEVLSIAPADSALVIERDINVKVALDLFTALLDQVEGPERTNDILKDLTTPLPLLGYSPREVIDRLDTRIIAIVKLDPSQTLPLPEFKSRIPMIHAMIAADNVGDLLNTLFDESKTLPTLRRESNGDWETLELMEPIDSEVPQLRPVLRRHRVTGRLYLATDLAFMDDCLNGGPSISQDKAFIASARDLPIGKGNGIFYASPASFQHLKDVAGEILSEDTETAWLKGLLGMIMPDVKSGELGVSINQPDGVYFISRSNVSHKVTLIEGLYANPLMLGALAYLTLGSTFFNMPDDITTNTPEDSEARVQVELCYWGAVRYYEAHQELPASVDWTPSLAPSATAYPLVPEDWQHPTWLALEFAMPMSHMYQYSFVHTGSDFSCMARGDLNGNGVFSQFERKGLISEEGYVEEVGGLIETNPGE